MKKIGLVLLLCFVAVSAQAKFTDELKAAAAQVWEKGYQHPFVQGIGQGTLSQDKFQYYLLQDYLYLYQYAKVYALAVVKATDEPTMRFLSETQSATLSKEMDLHRSYMKSYGISSEEMQKVKPAMTNLSYTSFMMATAQQGDLLQTLVAVLPCAWVYYDYAVRLKEQYPSQYANNPYKSWIEMYSNDSSKEYSEWFFNRIEELVVNKTKEERAALIDIFIQGVTFEYLFWDMAYNKQP